jgi:hypothetical protein
VVAIERLAQPCWVLDPEGGSSGEEHSHWPDEAGIRGHLEADDDRDPKVTIRRLPTPCWTVTCDGECEVTIDEEEEYVFHYGSRAEAESDAADMGWLTTDDGRLFCLDDAPDSATADLRRLEQIPGQLTLDGQEATSG